jgi:hypothetical protein
MFNGSEISKGTGNVYKLQQKRKLQSAREARLDDELVSTRAAIQYIFYVCHTGLMCYMSTPIVAGRNCTR